MISFVAYLDSIVQLERLSGCIHLLMLVDRRKKLTWVGGRKWRSAQALGAQHFHLQAPSRLPLRTRRCVDARHSSNSHPQCPTPLNMKLKDISRTATFAWDRSSSSSPLIATGAVAGALDESFSNDSQLEIWAPDFGEQGLRLGGEGKSPAGSITVSSRFVLVSALADDQIQSPRVVLSILNQ